MNFWMTFWGALFAVIVVGYALLAVVVTVGGARDLRSLFRKLHEERDSCGRDADKDEQTLP